MPPDGDPDRASAAPALIRGDRTAIRPVTAGDLALLARWFGDAEFVRRWGGVPKSRDDVARECLGWQQDDEIVLSFIVLRDDVPIGYLQAWSDEPRIGGIDIVLVPDVHGRGYGPDAVAALAGHLQHALGWTRITVDPALDNARGIRAFEKAGFVTEREAFDHPDGPSLIMAFRAAPSSTRPQSPP